MVFVVCDGWVECGCLVFKVGPPEKGACGVVKIPTLVSCIPIVFSIIVSLYIICGLLWTSLLT